MQSRHFSTRTEATSLADTVADTIRQQLIHGQLRAGQHLSEAALSQQLGVAATAAEITPESEFSLR